MQVNETIQIKGGGELQFGIVEHGGHSSWKESDNSIRLAWRTKDGGFDPISSSEMPIWGLVEMVCAAAERDVFDTCQLADMVADLAAALYRREGSRDESSV